MCGATTGGLSREGIDVSKETVIEGTVSKDGVPVTGYVRLLNADGEFTAEVPTSATGAFRKLTARRAWVCELPEGTASIFCGGTHLERLGELDALHCSLSLSEDGTELVAVTVPKLR